MDLQWLRDLAGIDPGKTVYRGPGFTVGEKAVTRIGRAPIKFTKDPFDVGGQRASGAFDTGSGDISVWAARSPRAVSRSVAHEDIHKAFQDKFGPRNKLNSEVTHGITSSDRDSRERTLQSLRALAGAESVDISDLERLIRMFDAADTALAR